MHVVDELDVVEAGEPQSAAMNMAIDEALLLSVTRPTLRFYAWRRPALSFGYFGLFADVAEEAGARELVRRWTGGGIVLHGDDLTYSIILPGRVTMPSRDLYSQIHRAIRAALPDGMNVALATGAAPKISEACFANAVESDVLVGERKIAGAAQRRTRAGLLHQGSIQCDVLPADFCTRFATALCRSFGRVSISSLLLRDARVIAERKYARDEWLRRR